MPYAPRQHQQEAFRRRHMARCGSGLTLWLWTVAVLLQPLLRRCDRRSGRARRQRVRRAAAGRGGRRQRKHASSTASSWLASLSTTAAIQRTNLPSDSRLDEPGTHRSTRYAHFVRQHGAEGGGSQAHAPQSARGQNCEPDGAGDGRPQGDGSALRDRPSATPRAHRRR